jgi:tetratricopeptide (TPR) repeat protein
MESELPPLPNPLRQNAVLADIRRKLHTRGKPLHHELQRIEKNRTLVDAENPLAQPFVELKPLHVSKHLFTLARSPEFHNLQSLIHRQRGETAKAIESLLFVLQSNPRHIKSLLNLGVILEKMGHVREAMHMFERTIDADPKSSLALFNLGNCYFKLGEFGAAVNMFNEALALDYNNPSFLRNRSLFCSCPHFV